MPEVIPQLFTPPVTGGGTVASGEPEILAARRAFGMAQTLLGGAPTGPVQSLQVGWYGSDAQEETGCFACVRAGAGQDALIGEILEVSAGGRSVFVYCLQALSTLPDTVDIALARRAYVAISRLSLEAIAAKVVAVEQ